VSHQILITDANGMPREWTDYQTAVCYHARDKVLWDIGDVIKTYTGGKNAHGEVSKIDIKPIIGVTGPLVGQAWLERTSVFVEREILYARDRYICCYCGHKFKPYQLTIDHVHPKSRGGKNIWMNAVSACKPCNHGKADRTPEEAGMPMLYVPYVPNAQEKFIMKNRNILADQMDFLEPRIPKHSRLWVDGKLALT
jgi:hypothetical protein